MDILYKIRYILVYPLLLLTIITTPKAVSTDSAKLISTDTFVFDHALVMGQGITTDGEYFYTSGTITAINTTAIAKFSTDTMDFVESNINPLPKICTERGNNHIGGISYYDGKLYAPVEGGDEVYACIVVFDADTLQATGEVYDLPNELYPGGVPWCAVDPETGYLYASIWKSTKVIHVYDTQNSMKHIDTINLKSPISHIQGAEFLNGTLYMSQDTRNKGSVRDILKVDITTGEVSVIAERDISKESYEAEGMTFTKTDDGVVLHVLDYNKAIGISVNHYEFDY